MLKSVWMNGLWRALFFIGIFTLASSGEEIQCTATFSPEDLSMEKALGFDKVSLEECAPYGHVGDPALPQKLVYVALPPGMGASEAILTGWEEVAIPGWFHILPNQEPRPTRSGGSFEIIQNVETYSSPLPLPGPFVEIVHQGDLGGVGLACVALRPLRYVPLEGRLSLLTRMEFTLSCTPRDGSVEGPPCTELQGEKYREMLEELVINPEDVQISSPPMRTGGILEGEYPYVIITTNTYKDAFMPLADWKTRKGLPANTVTTAWIYNNYSGSDNPAKIRNFILDAAASWGTLYVLIGGDTNVVPYDTCTYGGDVIPNDTYLADYDNDWVCELFVGRAPINSVSEVDQFVSRTLAYEKNPPATNYAKKIALFGFDLDWLTWGEGCKEDIDSSYIPSTFSLTKVYDSDSGNHQSDVLTALNAGQNVVNHIDHCNWNVMGVGSYNHGWHLYNGDMDSLNNGTRKSLLYSIGCWPCAIDYDCIAEHFVESGAGGGYAFIGNTRYGWYTLFFTNTLSMLFDRRFFRSLYSQGVEVLGETFADHKNDTPPGGDETMRYIWMELTLLGDPSLPIWTSNPSSLEVTHPESIQTGSQDFTVNVKKGGGNLQGALVCLWKGEEVYAKKSTGTNGNAAFTINPASGGDLVVTVTYRNAFPYEGTCEVEEPFDFDLVFLGGDPYPGEAVAFRIVAPHRPNQNVVLMVNNQPGSTYFPGLGITLSMSLNGLLIRYNSFGGGGRDLNENGEITLVVNNPANEDWIGTELIWQAVAGVLGATPDLGVSNTVLYILETP